MKNGLTVRFVSYLCYVFVGVPTLLVVIGSFSAGSTIGFPPDGLSFRWYDAMIHDSEIMKSLYISAQIAAIVAVASGVIGVLTALFVHKLPLRLRSAVQSAVLSPLSIPHVLIGLALLLSFAKIGFVTLTGLVIGHLLLGVPFVVRGVLGSMDSSDLTIVRAAEIHGASPIRSFFQVTLPTIRAGVISGTLFSFLMSFNNITISAFLSPPGKSTLPVVLLNRLAYVATPVVLAVSAVVVVATILLMALLEWRFKMFRSVLG